ncbi:MAG: hypothetical protein E7068_07460 [Lentimicrobiaceae bacterium]|nr:hypothetical protein [Lentimicrobiaceae bacterium]
MKKIFLILLAIVPLSMMGQNIYDIYNVSTSYYQGTAKGMAMGNAMGAVGEDFSSIAINPAGVGLFRKPTLIFTPSILTTYTKSELNGDLATDSKAKLSVNNFGIVGINKSGKRTTTWAIGMNRTNNFNNSIFVDGYNNNNSLIDAYFAEIIANDIYDEKELDYYSPSYIYPLWETYLINFENDGTLTTPVPAGGLRQLKGVSSWGGTNEWTFTSGINFGDKFFLGISINMPYVYSKKITDYKEEFTIEGRDYYWIQEEALATTGWGLNSKFGLIAHPCRWLRIGASIHTPTLYELTDSWKTATVSYLDFGTYEHNIPTSYFSYSMMTPWRANGSLALIFGNFGMITADYEYVDYSTIRIADNEYDYSEYNQFLSQTFKPTMNLRLGTEWRYQNMCFRGGYSFYGSPYGIESSDYRRNALSCGFGYTQHFFTIDFAYVYTLQNHSYNLYSQYTKYYEEVAPNLIVDEKTNIHSLVVSLKLKLY